MRDWGVELRSWLPSEAVRENQPLREKTTLRIGGPARYCVTVERREDMVRLVRECAQEGIDWFLLGGGSNVLFNDAGFDGMVIVNRIGGIEFGPGDPVACGAGVVLMDLVRAAESKSLAGLERMAGIPGSVGGAVVGNAGAFGQTIGDRIESIDIVTESGETRTVTPETLEIDYRETRLKYSKDVVLTARFRLEPGEREDLSRTISEILELRATKHPGHGVATAGSFFKNLPPPAPGEHRVPAGRILEEAGARGLRVGDAAVFEKHANIVVNRGGASALEVLELTGTMKQMAFDRSTIALEEEVRRIGFSEEELARYEIRKAATA
jgi:UDP-N-acetylmuramate dehydrogenase